MKIASLFRTKSIAKIQQDAAQFPTEGAADGELHRSLSVVDLTAMGIAAVIGAGIFSTIGNAAYSGGPAISLLFLFTAFACGCAALCYAEFASMIPLAGSAYTYAYASFGELVAWIIGWDLLLEYAIGNIAVAISWSDYFTGLLAGYGINVPDYLSMDFLSAARGYDVVNALLQQGHSLLEVGTMEGMSNAVAWTTAPMLGALHVVCDLPALAVVLFVTALVFTGITASKRAANIMVAFKLGIIFLVIVLGSFYVHPDNWSPFAPNGVSGILKGVSAVFFAYIGFDAISTTAEECKNPQRDLPRGMIYALIICTVLYALIALVLTGMVSYTKLAVGDPMAFVFGVQGANIPWISSIIAISAVIAMTTVLLVFQLGQPRIWMAMSRDGLLPPIFSSIHPRFKTPWFSTLVAGAVVAIPALFMNLTEVTDLTSIGTLFAFVLVSGGVLILDSNHDIERRFKTPYINAKYTAPALFAAVVVFLAIFQPTLIPGLLATSDPTDASAGSWDVLKHNIPLLVFFALETLLVIQCYRKSLSLIPVLGISTCGYLMAELGWTNWARFLIWLALGLIIYSLYSVRHSRLSEPAT